MSCFHDFLGRKYPGILEVTLLYYTSIGEPDQTYQLLSNRHASQLCLLFHTVFAVTLFMAREFNNLTVRQIFSVFSVFYNIIFFLAIQMPRYRSLIILEGNLFSDSYFF